MDITTGKPSNYYQLIAESKSTHSLGGALKTGRHLIGRSESCDFIISSEIVSSVHAVLEISPSGIKIFDMNSMNGTLVNGEKVIARDINLGDTLSFGNIEFKLQAYAPTPELPPVLDALEPVRGQASTMKNTNEGASELPKTPSPVTEVDVPYIVYPLSSDPNSDYSEYIFEDRDELYPIFKYELNKMAVEIIILFGDNVYSVDYLPQKDGVYQITGLMKKANEVEFPYLAKNEKLPFIEISSGNCLVHQLHNYDLLYLSDNDVKASHAGNVNLQDNDIVKLSNGNLEIYVRKVSAPPKVKMAPFFRRDKDLKKYIALVIFLILIPLISLQFITVEEPENVPDPERIATILYKQKLTVNTNKTVERTEKKKIEKKQKAKEKKVALKKTEPKKSANPLKSTKAKEVVKKAPGNKEASKVQVVKKVDKPLPKKSQEVSKNPSKSKATKSNNQKQVRFSNTNTTAVGNVDVYKSINFKSTVNSLMAKGGSLSGARTATNSGSNSLSNTSISGGVENIKNATVDGQVGSLTGSTVGKIGTTKGAGGLSAKTGVYTAGIPSETVVLGSMDPDVIRRILRENIPQFRSCYQRELNRNNSKDISGSIRLVFTIAASGSVSTAGVDGQTALPANVKRCVVGVLRGIQFPSPLGGGTVDVKQPFNFYPKRL